jgi:hypothetical protein
VKVAARHTLFADFMLIQNTCATNHKFDWKCLSFLYSPTLFAYEIFTVLLRDPL